jgi:hypothetical protein
MKPLVKRLPYTVPVWLLAISSSLFAQDEPHSVNLPNAMTIHTWFIIGATGAFLAWSLSYSIQLQRESLERRKSPASLLKHKEELLDKIADLEKRKEEGQITEPRYKHELRELKFHLAKVLERTAKNL